MDRKNPRIMAIDYGRRRVGIASTDETGCFALPRSVWSNDSFLVERVVEFCDKERIEKVVLGESKNLSGKDNIIQKEINELKKRLEARGISTVLHTEIFTTAEALRIQGRSNMIDASAAALILKSFIDTVYNN